MPQRRGGRGRKREARAARPERNLSEWAPKTKLGRLVLAGELTTLGDAIRTGLPIREPEIVDVLLPETEDEVLDVNMVQRMTDSGRRVNFVITCIVGNKDGFAGLGRARGREVGPSIRRAIDNAKLNMIEIKRGCGSWECGCGRSHTLPFKGTGRSGSVEVVLKPAPQGVGLAVGDGAKSGLRLAGITGPGGVTKGHTKTTVHYARAEVAPVRDARPEPLLDRPGRPHVPRHAPTREGPRPLGRSRSGSPRETPPEARPPGRRQADRRLVREGP